MPVPSSIVAALVLAGTLAGVVDGDGDLGAYLAEKDGRKALKEPLTLREEQGGIVGITGTLWTVEPSGRWQVARFSPNKDGTERLKPIRSGMLSPEQLESLARTLEAQDLMGLPRRTGPEAKVNPHRITIKFGQQTAALEGVPQRRDPKATVADHVRKSAPAKPRGDAAVWERFAHLIQAVETHCQAAESP